MKKGYLLLIGGIVPLIFLVYVYLFFSIDERKNTLQEATLYTNSSSISKGSKILFTGKLSSKQPLIEGNFGFLQEEEKVKGKDRSTWTQRKNHTNSMILELTDGKEVHLHISEGYVLCGSRVKILPIEGKDPKKFRKLGVEIGEVVTGYGEILELDPLTVNAGFSPCAESLEEYKASVNLTSMSYMLLILFISVPSLFLIYLGLFRVDENTTPNETV